MFIPVLIMARGEGQRLRPFTFFQSKPSLPFAGGNRIVDFTLYNATQLSSSTVYLLTPNQAPILEIHWKEHWSNISHLVPTQHKELQGNAQSVYEFLQTLPESKHVIITACDHIYQMSYRDFWTHHIASDADLTIATTHRSVDESSNFGVFRHNNDQIIDFVEKPPVDHPWMQEGRQMAVNMGIYIFKRNLLMQLLKEDLCCPTSQHDFGRNIIPLAISKSLHMQSYILPSEQYWEDVGTVKKYWDFQWKYQHQSQISKTLLGISTPTEIRTSPVIQSESSQIENCIIHPNVQLGAHCSLKNLLIGSHSVIDNGLHLSSTSQSFLTIPPHSHVTSEWVESRLMSNDT